MHREAVDERERQVACDALVALLGVGAEVFSGEDSKSPELGRKRRQHFQWLTAPKNEPRAARAQVGVKLAQAAKQKGLACVGGAVIRLIEDGRVENEDGGDSFRVD